MKGFKITNIDFHQAVTLPAGTYTYSCKARPVFSSITFRVGLTDYVISNLSPGVYQKGIKYTFTVESEQANFYPSRTVGDEIFEPQLEEGTKDTTAGPNILDEPEALSRAGIQITSDMARIYAKKGDVDASISLEAGLIRQEISDTNHRVSTVEQTVDSWSSTIIDGIEGRVSTVEQTVDSWSSTITDSGKIVSQILQEDGTVKIKAEQIELEGLVTANDNFKILEDGSIEAKNGKFTGTIDALDGTLGDLTMKSGGAIYLPPTYSSQKGRLDNSGLALIYAGNDSQKIEWYSGLGTIAGQITTTSEGQLKLLSSFGVRIGTDLIGDAISIAKSAGLFYHEIDLNSSELKNIRKLSTVGQINMSYTSHALSANTKYHLATDTALIVITSAGSGAGIYRITGTGNSNPSNGDVKILTNAASGATTVVLTATKPPTATYESNIKVPVTYEDNSFNLHENTSITLVYYGGYWRVQTDRGQ